MLGPSVCAGDDAKEAENIRKHGVDFDEGSCDEDRFIAIGWSHRARALFVVFCERGEYVEIIRIISAPGASHIDAAKERVEALRRLRLKRGYRLL